MFCEGVLEVLGRGRRNLEGGKQRAVSSCQRNSSSLGCTSFLGVGLALDFGKAAPPTAEALIGAVWRPRGDRPRAPGVSAFSAAPLTESDPQTIFPGGDKNSQIYNS